jgi:hypothetical protein
MKLTPALALAVQANIVRPCPDGAAQKASFTAAGRLVFSWTICMTSQPVRMGPSPLRL